MRQDSNHSKRAISWSSLTVFSNFFLQFAMSQLLKLLWEIIVSINFSWTAPKHRSKLEICFVLCCGKFNFTVIGLREAVILNGRSLNGWKTDRCWENLITVENFLLNAFHGAAPWKRFKTWWDIFVFSKGLIVNLVTLWNEHEIDT